MSAASFAPLRAELEIWRAERRRLEVWLRDDDVVKPAPQLDRLLSLAAEHRAPVALAVIPSDAEPALAERLAEEDAISVLPHGWAHINHAPPSAKKSEFGADRSVAARRADAASGWMRIKDLFGSRATPIFTPPWNRAAPDLHPHLAALGFSALSSFRPRRRATLAPALTALNTHLDPIDWKGGRSLVDPEALVSGAVAALVARREGRADATEPYGLLTHCLVHDAAIWDFLSRLFEQFADLPEAVQFIDIAAHAPRPREGVASE